MWCICVTLKTVFFYGGIFMSPCCFNVYLCYFDVFNVYMCHLDLFNVYLCYCDMFTVMYLKGLMLCFGILC